MKYFYKFIRNLVKLQVYALAILKPTLISCKYNNTD